jgi:hypothetical protein
MVAAVVAAGLTRLHRQLVMADCTAVVLVGHLVVRSDWALKD